VTEMESRKFVNFLLMETTKILSTIKKAAKELLALIVLRMLLS
jgi:hypothetical protein